MQESEKVILPTTSDEFDALIKILVENYKLPSYEHAAAVVANRIMHMSPTEATTTHEHLAHCVLKNMAFQVAQAKGSQIQHKFQIDQLDAILKNNHFDQQALDALQKATDEGSTYAKEILEKYQGKTLRVVENIEPTAG